MCNDGNGCCCKTDKSTFEEISEYCGASLENHLLKNNEKGKFSEQDCKCLKDRESGKHACKCSIDKEKKHDDRRCEIEQELRIHEIFISESENSSMHSCDEKKFWVIKPQQIVTVILEEVHLNSNNFAFLFSRLATFRKGLWIIEPSFVQPNYKGYLTVHVCNLSRSPTALSKGESIVDMVTFSTDQKFCNHKSMIGLCPHSEEYKNERDKYLHERRAESFIFPNTFLDIEDNVKKIHHDIGQKPLYNMFTILLTMFSLVVALAAWLNVTNIDINDRYTPEELQKAVRAEIIANEHRHGKQ